MEPTAPGDPESPLRWTSRSVRTLAVALEGLGHHVSHTVVAELLHALGYSLQGSHSRGALVVDRRDDFSSLKLLTRGQVDATDWRNDAAPQHIERAFKL